MMDYKIISKRGDPDYFFLWNKPVTLLRNALPRGSTVQNRKTGPTANFPRNEGRKKSRPLMDAITQAFREEFPNGLPSGLRPSERNARLWKNIEKRGITALSAESESRGIGGFPKPLR
jgi:hypothetical protein